VTTRRRSRTAEVVLTRSGWAIGGIELDDVARVAVDDGVGVAWAGVLVDDGVSVAGFPSVGSATVDPFAKVVDDERIYARVDRGVRGIGGGWPRIPRRGASLGAPNAGRQNDDSPSSPCSQCSHRFPLSRVLYDYCSSLGR
jgi:hypothetical protein